LVIARLSDPEHAAQVSAFTSKRAERLTEVRTEIEQVRRLQEGLAERLGRQEMELTAFDVANKPLAAKLATLTEEREALESGGLGPLDAATAEEIATEWDALGEADDVEGQRVMLRRALGRHSLVIDRARNRAPRFDVTRLRLRLPK
jgi:DNA repair exonuclease SbcCD ATPase subunit